MGIATISERVWDAVMDPRLVHGFPKALYRHFRYRPGWAESLRPRKVYVCVTFDVEGNFRDVLNPESSIHFMPKFLAWADQIGLRATLYVQGSVVSAIHEYLREASKNHQIGLHGFLHEVWGRARWWQSSLNITPIPRSERRAVLQRAIDEFEAYRLARPTAFRAPYLNIDKISLEILRDFGFRSDSSVSSFLGRLPVPTCNGEMWELPVSAHPRVRAGKSAIAPFSFRDFSLGNLASMDKQTFLEAVDSVVAVQRQAQSLIPPHVVMLAHPWEFVSDGGVEHASEQNFLLIEERIDWIRSEYEVELVTVAELIDLASSPGNRH